MIKITLNNYKIKMNNLETLIVGAGPSGMVCALALIKAGKSVQIIDKRPQRSSISKATGVSLGTINALTKLGFSKNITELMTPMSRFVFYEDDKVISNLNIPFINNEPPAYLYPQLKLEQLIEKQLNNEGLFVEYRTSIRNVINNEQFTEVTIEKSDTSFCTKKYKRVIGADGAHSKTREIGQFEYKGKEYPEQWSVAEIVTDAWDSQIQAKLYLRSNGVGLFLSNPENGIVQGILNAPDVEKVLKDKFPVAKFNYSRGFKVSLKRVTSPKNKNIWLIGDAAHVQSPVGGQGLNLAIADALILSNLVDTDEKLAEKLLIQRAYRTLLFTDFDYQMLSTRNLIIRKLRNLFWGLAERIPAISMWFFKSISGVKHYKYNE